MTWIWEAAVTLGKPVTWMQRSKITGGFVDAAIPFMKKAQRDGKPFYINLWPDDVHSPFWPPVEKWGDGGKRDLYWGVLEAMDTQFGKLFDHVRNNEKLKNNTLILICSDNGHEPGAGRAGVLKGCKTNLFEGGIRSPLVVWAPGLMTKKMRGTRNKDSVFSAIDLVPSLIRLVGAQVPEGVRYDGEDVLDTVLGKSQASRSKPIFFRRPPDRKEHYGYKQLPDLAVRDKQWKLLCDYDGGRPQLFNILEDPSEKNNLSTSHPDQVKALTAQVVDWNATMPQDNGKTLGEKAGK